MLNSYVEMIHNQVLQHHMNNQNVDGVLPHWEQKTHSTKACGGHFQMNIQVVPKGIPRKENVAVDDIQKLIAPINCFRDGGEGGQTPGN